MNNETSIKLQKELFQKSYDKWRNLDKKKDIAKTKQILYEMDEIAKIINQKDYIFTSSIYVRLATLSSISKDFETAKKYFTKVTDKAQYLLNDEDILEFAYRGLGDLYFEKQQFKEASKQYYMLQELLQITDFLEEDILQMGIAMVNNSENKYLIKAEELLSFVYQLDICNEEMDHLMTTETNYNLGLAKFKLKKYKEAKPYLKKALVLYKQQKLECNGIYLLLNNIEEITNTEPLSANN